MKKLPLFFALVLCVPSIVFSQEDTRPSNFFTRLFKKNEKSPKLKSRENQKKIPKKILVMDNTDDLTVNMSPKKYRKRAEPILNIGLVYYGDYYSENEFARVQSLLEERFELATKSLLKLNVVFRAILPFKNNIASFPDYTQPNVTDMERLQRLWYYDNKGIKVVSEIYNEIKEHEIYGDNYSNIDALAVVTGAQFDGLGFASGRVAVTENPMEIAWGSNSGGRVEFQSDAKVVDELIHELAHTLHIGHAAEQCFSPGMKYEEILACCAVSPNKDDVQSYCRDRSKVDESFFYSFESCNLQNIKNIVVPAMLNGEKWAQDMEKCE